MATTTAAPMAPATSSGQAKRCGRYIGKWAAVSLAMSAAVVVLGGHDRPWNTPKLMRSASWTPEEARAVKEASSLAAAARFATRKPIMRHEKPKPSEASRRLQDLRRFRKTAGKEWGASAPAVTGGLAGRPKQWGTMMRKEAAPVVTGATAARPEQWGTMMRKEAAPAVTGAPAPRPKEWGTMMRKEAAPVVHAAMAARPVQWGTMMRKEAAPAVAGVTAPRPKEWGTMMRKEAAPVVTGATAARPEQWGSMMRKEAAPIAPVVLASAAQKEGIVASPAPTPRQQKPVMMVFGVIVACLSLFGFAQQVKQIVDGLMKATHPELCKGKSK